MTWWKNKPEKKRKSNSSAHIIIQEQCYVLLCFNKKSDIFSAKYENFAPNWLQWNCVPQSSLFYVSFLLDSFHECIWPFLLLGMVAGMPLSSFLLFHCALVVVVVVVDGHVAIGLSLSQHCLLLAHRLRYLLPQLSTFWHITIEQEVISDKHALLKTNENVINHVSPYQTFR